MAVVLVLTSMNMTASAAGGPSINMGTATFSDADQAMYYSNLTVSGDLIRTIMISFSEITTSGDAIILPAVSAGFEVSPSSSNYVKRINVGPGVTTADIQDLLRHVGFRVAGDTQTVSITVTTDNITTDTFYNKDTGHYYQFIPSSTTSWGDAYASAKSSRYMGRTGYLATVTSKAEDVFLNTLSGGKTGWLGGTILTNNGQKVDATNGTAGDLLYYSQINPEEVVSTGWYWACGPEIGTTFFNVNSLRTSMAETSDALDAANADAGNPSTYYNWARGSVSFEPNNVTADNFFTDADYEACLTTLTVAGNQGKQGTDFSWNDKNYTMSGTGEWDPKGYFIEFGNQTIGDVGSDSSAYATDTGALSGVQAMTDNMVHLTTLNWLTPTTYHCDLELSALAKMITISVDNGYFTIPSLGTALTFRGGTKGSTYLDSYSSNTQQFDSATFSFTDVDGAMDALSDLVYVTVGATPQSIQASASTKMPVGNDIYFKGHYYRYVSTPIDWQSAALAAGGTADPYFGGRGYLATATSQPENSILLKLTDNGGFGSDHWNDAWLGGLWQRNTGTVVSPEIQRGVDGNEITYHDLLGATSFERCNMLLDYSELYDGSDGYIYTIPNVVKYYWLDGPEAGQEIAYNDAGFAPWHAGEPNGGDFIYIGWEGAYWDDLSADVSTGDDIYSALSGYVVEFSGFEGGSDAGIIKNDTKVVVADILAPTLTPRVVNRFSQTEAKIYFDASEAGQYYYSIVDNNAPVPTVDTSGVGNGCVTGENILIDPVGLTRGEKDIYIRMKDSVGNLSNQIKLDIYYYNTTPAFVGETTSLTVASNSMNNDLKPYLHVSDPDYDQQLVWIMMSPPMNGITNCTSGTTMGGGSDITPNGTMTYTPNPGFCGEDSFSILILDGYDGVPRTIHVFVTDQTKPTVTITQGTNHWNSFLNTITFGLFFKDTIEVSLSAQDQGGSGLKSVQYIQSSTPMTLEELQSVSDWKTYTSAFQITPVDKQKNIIYAKVADNAGNITVVSSDGMEFDLQEPTIITNYQKGDSSMEVTVEDEGSQVDSVAYTVNQGPETPATLVNGKFTIPSLPDGRYDVIVTATDRVGNSTTKTIPVVSLHTVAFNRYSGDPAGPVKSEIVEYGHSATAPTGVTRAGFSFAGWDRTFSNITSDLVVNGTWNIDAVSVLPYTGIYDGLSHSCVTVSGTLPGDVIRYSINGGEYSTICPLVTDNGTYTILVTVDRAGYSQWISASKTARIEKKALSTSMITGLTSYKHTGQPLRPEPIVRDGQRTLSKGTDYTVAYSDNTDIGIATVTIVGMGNYENTVQQQFAIYANNTAVHVTGQETPNVMAQGLEKLYEDQKVYTEADRIVEENGGSVNIELSVQAQTSSGTDQSKITQMAKGKEIGLFLDISLLKTVQLAGAASGTTSPVKHTDQLLTIVIPIPDELKNKDGITLYRVHEGVPSVIPVGVSNAVDGEYCTVDENNITLYVQNFSTYAIGYNQAGTIPKSPQTGEETEHFPVVGGGILVFVVAGVAAKRKRKSPDRV